MSEQYKILTVRTDCQYRERNNQRFDIRVGQQPQMGWCSGNLILVDGDANKLVDDINPTPTASDIVAIVEKHSEICAYGEYTAWKPNEAVDHALLLLLKEIQQAMDAPTTDKDG